MKSQSNSQHTPHTLLQLSWQQSWHQDRDRIGSGLVNPRQGQINTLTPMPMISRVTEVPIALQRVGIRS